MRCFPDPFRHIDDDSTDMRSRCMHDDARDSEAVAQAMLDEAAENGWVLIPEGDDDWVNEVLDKLFELVCEDEAWDPDTDHVRNFVLTQSEADEMEACAARVGMDLRVRRPA